jgi:hypothetical protein
MNEKPSIQNTDEIIIYQPDNSDEPDKARIRPDSAVRLEVRLENETVWLTQNQIVDLFTRDRTVITKHINNIFKEGELDEKSNVQFLHIANSDKPVKFYNLNVIISVGYRIKSQRGTQFRIWATSVLKDYLLKGYAVNQRFERIEERVSAAEKKIDFFVKTALPPIEGIFYAGQIFDAYIFVADLVKSAKKTIVLIDNYIDESVLMLLSKRNSSVGASLKDLGKKLFAFSKLVLDADELLQRVV